MGGHFYFVEGGTKIELASSHSLQSSLIDFQLGQL